MMDPTYSGMTANAICHAVEMIKEECRFTLGYYQRPSTIYKPTLSRDGNQWCALFGANLHDGVAGFGDTPAKAMENFDHNWNTETIPPKKAGQ